MNWKEIGIIIYAIILLVGILFVYSELKERNELLADDPCEYYKEHCVAWDGMESTPFTELYSNETRFPTINL